MARNYVFHCCQEPFLKLLFSVGIWTILNMIPNYSFSQTPPPVTIDGSLQGLTGSGNNSGAQALSGQDITVTREMGLVKGKNLFHSFGQFNVPTEGSVTFTAPNSIQIQNILSRVTGNDVSNIDGTLASTIEGADVYLMNPNGIIFGEKASLDVKGSFYATTANNIELADGKFFNAIPDQQVDALLISAPPEAFGFLDSTSESIIVDRGLLEVPERQSVMLIGGDIDVTSTKLTAPGGQIVLVSTDSPGKVILADSDFHFDSFQTFGGINISGESTLSSTGVASGKVFIRGGRFVMDGESSITSDTTGKSNGPEIGVHILSKEVSIRNDSKISSSTTSEGKSGKILITATEYNSFSITDSSIVSNSESGKGRTGGIALSGPVIELKDSRLSSNSNKDGGKTGVITINATDRLSITGSDIESSSDEGGDTQGVALTGSTIDITDSLILSETFDGGQTGGITFNASRILSLKNSKVSSTTEESNKGGSIKLAASVAELKNSTINAESIDSKAGGNIQFDVDQLTLAASSEVSTETDGNGKGGNIQVFAEQGVTIFGIEQGENNTSRLNSSTSGEGDGGSLRLETGRLTLTEGGQLRSRSFDSGKAGDIKVIALEGITISGESGGTQSSIDSGTATTGKAGSITFETSRLSMLNGGALSSSSQGQENGGSITVTASDTINLAGPKTKITSESSNNGSGGNIALTAGNGIQSSNRATLTGKSSGVGSAGEVSLTAIRGSIFLDTSTVTTEAQQSDGGNIKLMANQKVELNNQAQVTAKSIDGNAGDISLEAEDSILIADGFVTTSSSGGDGGNIDLVANNIIFVDPSVISSSVGNGVGGNIMMESNSIVFQESQVLAKATGGQGGNISMSANVVLQDPFSKFDASAGPAGIDGIVNIRAPIQNLNGTIAPLPENIINATRLYSQRCAAQKNGKFSSFAQGGRVGFSTMSLQYLHSPLVFSDEIGENSTSQNPLNTRRDLTNLRLTQDRNFSKNLESHGLKNLKECLS